MSAVWKNSVVCLCLFPLCHLIDSVLFFGILHLKSKIDNIWDMDLWLALNLKTLFVHFDYPINPRIFHMIPASIRCWPHVNNEKHPLRTLKWPLLTIDIPTIDQHYPIWSRNWPHNTRYVLSSDPCWPAVSQQLTNIIRIRSRNWPHTGQ